MWPFWKEWINLNPECVQSQGGDLVFENFQALRRRLCCHMEASWMINFQSIFLIWNISKYFQRKTRKKGGRGRGRRKRWLSLPSGKELETFIQRNFLPINVSVHPDQNLQTAYHPKPKHLSLFFSEKWRVLILVSASKLPEQWCWVQEGVTTSPCLPLWFIRHSQENRECWEWIKMMWGQGKWWLQMRPMSCFQKYSSL